MILMFIYKQHYQFFDNININIIKKLIYIYTNIQNHITITNIMLLLFACIYTCMAATNSDLYVLIPAGIAFGLCICATIFCVICIVCCLKDEEDDLTTPAQTVVPPVELAQNPQLPYVTYIAPYATFPIIQNPPPVNPEII